MHQANVRSRRGMRSGMWEKQKIRVGDGGKESEGITLQRDGEWLEGVLLYVIRVL